MKEKKPLVILTGPTAVGKTDLSISLAKSIGGEIISADSMQIYKYMDIGTAKIMQDEMNGVKHFLIDELEPDEEFNVVVFQQMAKKAMEDIYSRGKIPIIVGGTGFYIQAVLYDIDFKEMPSDAEKNNNQEVLNEEVQQNTDMSTVTECQQKQYRNKLMELADKEGNNYIFEMLKQVDPNSAEKIHPNNVKRVIRALEYFYETGECISKHNEEQKQKESPYNFMFFVLNDDRQVLYQRIDQRVDKMFDKGLVMEVKKLIAQGYTKDLVSMQGIGYKEIIDYLQGQYDIDRAKYIIKRDTRHFAKRQITWFKREPVVEWMNYQDYNNSKQNMLAKMTAMLKEREIIK